MRVQLNEDSATEMKIPKGRFQHYVNIADIKLRATDGNGLMEMPPGALNLKRVSWSLKQVRVRISLILLEKEDFERK